MRLLSDVLDRSSNLCWDGIGLQSNKAVGINSEKSMPIFILLIKLKIKCNLLQQYSSVFFHNIIYFANTLIVKLNCCRFNNLFDVILKQCLM